MKLSARELVLVGLFAAITAVCAQISIPLPFTTVPFTLQVLAVCLSGAILGKRLGALSQIVYLLLGAIGIPVFAGFSGGLSKLVGNTGGYLIAFPIAALIIGYVFEKRNGIIVNFLSMLAGLIVIYAIGVTQLKFVAGLPWPTAYVYGAAPFIILDVVKAIIATAVAAAITPALSANNLLPYSALKK
jgi:biotin transport system substrate-specific component